VRVSLRGDQRWLVPEPGRVVMLTGHLASPPGPSEPGDFDFRRAAWFEGLGAVGHTQNPVLTAAPPQGGLWLHRLRAHLSGAVTARIGGDGGGLAAAVMTGDRSGISAEANQAMRDAGLYHLVSISGMHMGMLVAFAFGLVRTLVALVPYVALRVDGRKVAALAALPVAAFYLALAGRDVATERAFVTVAVMLGAILLDRRAISLRSVAVAALVVLALRPESVVGAGFQMSFAAVVALTWTFGGRPPLGPRWVAPVAMLLLSSLVAGLATAPFAGAHFNRFAAYGLLGNLLAVPAMGLLVMPGAAILALLGPLGIEQPALLMIEGGCRWILLVSEWVASLDGASWAMPAPPPAVLPLLTLGGLLVVLWRGWGRWAGVPAMALALLLWVDHERPALLVSESGRVIGVLGPEGRALSHATGEGFAVEAWLGNDGEVADQEAAAARPGIAVEGRTARAVVGGATVLLARGVRALAAIEGCGGADVVVTDEEAGARPCVILDTLALREAGSVAGRVVDGRLVLVTAAEVAGRRPWTGP
jgi:competence protein ComEC